MSTSPRTGHDAVESESDREAAAAAAAAERSASLWGRFNTAKRRYVAAVQGLPLLARVAPGVLPATVPAAAPTKGKVNVTLFSSITRPEMEAITEFRVARSAIASAHRALVRGGEAAPAKVSLEEVLGVPLPPPAARMAYRMANVSAPLMHCMFTAHGFKPSGNCASTFGGEAAPTTTTSGTPAATASVPADDGRVAALQQEVAELRDDVETLQLELERLRRFVGA